MEFEYTGSVYVNSIDLRDMYLLCMRKGLTPSQAFCVVSKFWDDNYYHKVNHVRDQIIEEINRRLAQSS